ncbi:MAG: phosphonate monoester hydrolase [Bordetella sp. SCN 67-23]|nr:sulfatase-like hydrolase/transferase [Burkholderiales bacterium]ODS73911.1 MAG: phosphonate monoester hydrolase [Bordetella sp. SCN 67-23]OJW94363.1 MAG: phosphonate monoester hydrolase [Burkholderiales bacterium 67-32]
MTRPESTAAPAAVRNVLFIMCDQLRADYLGCYGHPSIRTPNIDALASRGVRFTRAYCSAPTCGPSRMSFYTGRSMTSHGAIWNFMPLSIGQPTIGDWLRPRGVEVALAGKTHFAPDVDGLRRVGAQVQPAAPVLEGGFLVVDRYEGHANPGPGHPYTKYLKAAGYDVADPWSDFVIAGEDEAGRPASGWEMRNAHYAARVEERHSETAYTTDVAIDFIRRQQGSPWLLHVSYIKPHWPYIAPSPYHAMYGPEDCLPVCRDDAERDDPHPVYGAYLRHGESSAFSQEKVASHVKPTYMGLVTQIDDHLGRLLEALRATGQYEDTLIVFTSDHGDYLGDHWLGEKDLFHDPSSRIPLIMVDPRAEPETRGSSVDRPVESIDFLATVVDAFEVPDTDHVIEGMSLLPFSRRGSGAPWRFAAVSELDYAFREARVLLGQDARRCRGYMVRSDRWKYIYWEGFAPQLFDMREDPMELRDAASNPGHAGVLALHKEYLFDWLRQRKTSLTVPSARIVVSRDTIEPAHGIRIGVW